MKFLCLICAETMMEQMPQADARRHFEEYREFTEAIEVASRIPGASIGCVEVRPVAQDEQTLRALGFLAPD